MTSTNSGIVGPPRSGVKHGHTVRPDGLPLRNGIKGSQVRHPERR